MTTIQVVDTQEITPLSLAVLLPGWADEASMIPHPAALLEPMEMALCRLLSVELPNHTALPGAQCLWRSVSDHLPSPPHLVCASPVHVIAGSDDAQLITAYRLNLTMDETQTMIHELNEALAENSCSFLHDEAGHWYYQGLPADALDASPPSAVEGHPMSLAMPRADEARAWRSLWSESQMVLHQSTVNLARQNRGEPQINSLWFWGGGPMPSRSPSNASTDVSNTVLYTDDRFGIGLADALNIDRQPLEAFAQLDLTSSRYRRHVVLDSSLLHGNPDFISQRDLGALWSQRISGHIRNGLDAELNGLTGCREVFMAKTARQPSMFSRIASMFQR